MQMRMIRDGGYSHWAYFMILRMAHTGVLVCTRLHAHMDILFLNTCTWALTHYWLGFLYLWPGNGSRLCLVELCSTILSHVALTSNTTDKPILFLSTESSPCPKITLFSLEIQQRWMVSRGVDSSLWHLQFAWKGKQSHLASVDFLSFQKHTKCTWRAIWFYILF